MKYITFPWEQLGQLLRRLSLSGAPGDIAAWILFLILGALPLAAALILRRSRLACRADMLLIPLSAAVYGGLWLFTNPSYIERYLSPVPLEGFAGYALAATMDSLLLTWLLLRYVLYSGKMEHGRLLSHLRILVILYVALSAAAILWQEAAAFLEECASLKERGSQGDSFLLAVSTFFLAFQALAGLLPVLCKLALLLMAGGFLDSYGKDAFGGEAIARMNRLRLASSRFLIAILLSTVSLNVLQLLFSRFLLSSHYQVLLPLSEILVILGIRMVSSLYLEGRRLKEDNDMFI